MLACFTLVCIAPFFGCSSSSTSPATGNTGGTGAETFGSVCPQLRIAPREGGTCTTPDGGSIDAVTLPSGCEGPPFDGGAPFDRSIFEGQPSLMVDDDDCKYDVTLTRACLPSSLDMAFLLNLDKRAGDGQATGAIPSIVAYEGLTHPAPNVKTVVSELEPGVYAISPVRFDRAGTWTLELHVYEKCPYGPGSPHGHANFEIDVP
jgi:hypothetical protein